VPLEVLIVCVLGNRNTLGVLYISYSVVDDQRHKQPPRLAPPFVHSFSHKHPYFKRFQRITSV